MENRAMEHGKRNVDTEVREKRRKAVCVYWRKTMSGFLFLLEKCCALELDPLVDKFPKEKQDENLLTTNMQSIYEL